MMCRYMFSLQLLSMLDSPRFTSVDINILNMGYTVNNELLTPATDL